MKPTKEPKATDYIQEMIEMTNSLIKKGFAYENKAHVYFSVSKFKNYGKLSNKNLDELKAGSRIEISDLKKSYRFCTLETIEQGRSRLGVSLGKRKTRVAFRVFSNE